MADKFTQQYLSLRSQHTKKRDDEEDKRLSSSAGNEKKDSTPTTPAPANDYTSEYLKRRSSRGQTALPATQNSNSTSDKTEQLRNLNSNLKVRELAARLPDFRGEIASTQDDEDEEEKRASGWEIAGNAAMKGIASAGHGIASTLDFLVPTDFLGEYDPFSWLNEDTKREYENYSKKLEENLEGRGTATRIAADVGTGTVAAIPNAIMALMSGGSSLAAQGTAALSTAAATATSTGLAATVGTAAREMVKNPLYWTSIAQTLGPDYEEAKANGASDLEAAATAIISSALNARVEIGGGLEVLPDRLRQGGSSAISQWVKGMLEEGQEEVVQGVISGIAEKAVYDRDKEYFSMSDQEAVINPGRMATEFGMGAAVGGILGGGQIGAVSAANAVANRVNDRRMGNLGSDYQVAAEDVVNEGLTFAPESTAYQTAQALKAKLDAGETVTDQELGRAVVENERAIQTEQALARANQEPADALSETAREVVAREANVPQSEAVGETDREQPVSYRNVLNQTRQTAKKAEIGYGEYGTKAFNELLESEQAAPDQLRSRFQSAYEAGLTDMPVGRVNLETDVQRIAFNAGKQDYIMSQKRADTGYATVYGKDGGFIQTDAAKGVDSGTVETLNALGKAAGVKIRYENSVYGGRANGSYANGIVTIARDAANPDMVVAKHEITHHMQQVAPKQYTEYRNYAVQLQSSQLGQTGTTLVERYQNRAAEAGVRLSTEQAMDEIAADFTERILTDEKALRDFAQEMRQTAEKRTVAQKFFDAVHDFIQKVKRAFGGNKAKMDQAAKDQFGATVAQLEKAEQLWKEAFKATAKKVESGAEQEYTGGEEQYSMKNGRRAQRGRSIEMETMENNRFERLRQFRGDLPDQWYAFTGGYFYIYSNQSFMDYTVLAKVSITQKNRADIDGFVEELENGTFQSAKTFDRWASYFRRGKGRYSWDRVRNGDRGAAVQTHGVDERARGSNDSADPQENSRVGEVSTGDDVRYSLITDRSLLNELESGKKVKVYRAMQLLDGELYPPMAALVKNESGKKQRVASTEIGKWYQADENPRLIRFEVKDKGKKRYLTAEEVAENEEILFGENTPEDEVTLRDGRVVKFGELNPKFELNKGNDAMVPAAYNPYFHTSASPLNDQFSSAFDRPNIVVVEGYIPADELTSGYKAQYAKDSVGETSWHAGPVAGKLRGDKARRVFLSRYFKAERVVPVNEVAKTIAKTLEGEGVSVPWNVVTPDLRAALERQGVEIDYRDAKMGSKVVTFESTRAEPARFSLKDVAARVEAGKPVNARDAAQFSLKYDSKFMENAMRDNAKFRRVPDTVMQKAAEARQAVADIFNDPKLADSLGLPPDVIGKTYIPNGSYSGTEENTTVCIRSIAADALMDAVAENLGRPLTVEDTIAVSQEYWKYTDKPECLYCYVAMDRKSHREFLGSYLKQRDAVLKAIRNGENRAEVYQKFLDGRKDTGPMKDRFNMWLRNADRDLITPADLASYGNMEKALERNPALKEQINDALKYAQGASWAKKRVSYAAYNGHILKWRKSRIDSLNSNYGLRMYSFSDFSPAFILENMQMITDAAVRNLKVLAYTKELDFVRIFAKTGMNINISVFGYDDGRGGVAMDGMQGADWTEAQDLRNQYKNVGCTFVATNDAQVNWALDQDWIDVIIPFHMVRTGTKVADYFGWKNYTAMSADAKTKAFDSAKNVAHILPPVHQNDKGKYLQAIRENNLEPRFKDWVKHPNYMKLVNETRQSEAKTKAVQPVFDLDAAKASIEVMRKRGGYYTPIGGSVEEMYEIAGEIADSIRGAAQFSLKGQSELLKENEKLKEVNETLREQFKTTKFAQVDKKSLDAFTKKLLQDYQSGADINETRDALNDLYTYMANGEDGQAPAWNEVQRRAYETAVSVLEGASTVNDDLYQEYKQLRKRLRDLGMTINPEYDHDLAGYESINEFRKANFGRIKLVKNGIPVDVVYEDLADTYPEFFDAYEYTTQADQLSHIAEVLDSLQPYEVNPYTYNMRESATWLASDIIERFYELPQAKPTFADKAQQKLTKQVIKDAKKLENLREQKNERIAKLIDQNRERVKNTQAKERVKRAQAVERVRQHYETKEAKASDRRKASMWRKKIQKHVDTISKMLLKGNDNSHVPEEMRTVVGEFLSVIDLTTPRQKEATINRLNDLRTLYKKIADNESEISVEVDPDLAANMDEVLAALRRGKETVSVADLSTRELESLYRVILAVERSIYMHNKAMAAGKTAEISELAQKVMIENSAKKAYAEHNRYVQFAADMVNMEMLNPQDYFIQLGDTMNDMFQTIRDGFDAKIRHLAEAQQYMNDLLGGADVKSMSDKKATAREFKTGNGKTIRLTPAQVMSLYLLQRQPDALDHIYKGGIKPAPVVALDGKGRRPKVQRSYEVVQVTPEDVANILNSMTPEQKKIAEGIGQFFTDYTAQWGNEVSLALYGYKKFTVENYFPIVSDQNYLKDVFGETNDATLKNMGSTKARIKGASNPVIIEDVFDVFSRQADTMSSYNAFVIPLSDIQRVYNFKTTNGSVKQSIEKKFGIRATQYFKKLMTDINGGGRWNGGSQLMNEMISRYKQAKLGLNLRVIVQQPTAMLRAQAVIDSKYIAKAMTARSSVDMETIFKYAPIAQWKDWGFFSMDTGKQMKDVILGTKQLSDYTMWAAGKMDEITWKRLWVASEMEIRDKQKELEIGSEEYLQAVGKRFSEIIDRTQVVDSVLHRSQIMRNPDTLVKMSVSFMNEPFKAYNMLRTAVSQAKNNPSQAAKQALWAAGTAYLTTLVVNHLITAMIDTYRGDEDDEEWLEKMFKKITGQDDAEDVEPKTWWQRYWWHFADNAVNEPLSMFPVVKDLVSLVQGYDVKRMDMQGLGDLVNAAKRGLSDKYTAAQKVLDIGSKLGDLFGVPMSSLKREIESAAKLALGAAGSPKVQYELDKMFYTVTGNKSRFMDILYEAYKDGDMKVYNEIVRDLIDEGLTPSYIESGMKSRAKKDNYVAGYLDKNSFIAGIELKLPTEKKEEDKFELDDLTSVQYTRYNEEHGELLEDIVDDFQRRGFGSLDEETANALLSAAYAYAEETALENASGGQYESDTKWVGQAQDAGDLGMTAAEYLWVKGTHDASITADGVYDAYEAGVDVDTYLTFRDMVNDLEPGVDYKKGDTNSRKAAIVDLLNSMGLTQDDYDYLFGTEYKSKSFGGGFGGSFGGGFGSDFGGSFGK